MQESRRDSLKRLVTIGAVAAAPAVRAQDSHLPDAHASDQSGYEHSPYKAPEIPPYSPKTLTAAEGAIVSRIADLIIPATDTPGALAAGVPQFIDNSAAVNPARRQVIGDGVRWIDAHAQSVHGQTFIALAAEQQIALLTSISFPDADKSHPDGAAFFRALKDMTVDGYYGSYAGLVEELGYRGNQMLASFPGCTHEH